MEDFVDHLIEDEAERESLLAKPTCFIIFGKPGAGKSTLARRIAESWSCILIDDTDLLNAHVQSQTEEGKELLHILSEGKSVADDKVLQLILSKLNSPDVEHYGYVLSCLPFMSEEGPEIHQQIEQIRNLKLPPDFIINIKCADEDLVQRLSGVKQHPDTGRLYTRGQWEHEEVFNKTREDRDEGTEVEEEPVQLEAEELTKEVIDQMVHTPENLERNALVRIKAYKDTMLRPLQILMAEHNPLYLLELDGNSSPDELVSSIMSHLGSMAVMRVSVPILLHQSDHDDLLEEISTEDLLGNMSSSRTVVPGFRWKRSRWGRVCPVALKEGKVINGKPEFSVGFQDKLYILSSQDAYQKFVSNPRPYLLPPMPRAPCKVSIVGPPLAGKSTVCRLLAQHYNAVLLDMEEVTQPLLAKLERERLDKIRHETTEVAIEKIRMKTDEDGGQNSVTEDHPEVQAIVLSALEEAKRGSLSSHDLYAEALQKRIKEIEEMDSATEGATGWVLDNFPMNMSQMDVLQQAGILPDIIFCLTDSEGHEVMKRTYETNKESINAAVESRLLDEQSQEEKQGVLMENVAEEQPNLETIMEADEVPEKTDSISSEQANLTNEEAVVPQDQWVFGYPDGPEMDKYKLQLQQFQAEWEQMKAVLTVTQCVLEISSKNPENLLQEMLQQLDKPFTYTSWNLSAVDLDEEAEDVEALAELERAEEASSDSYAAEEDEGDTASKRSLGDTRHFCPVALKTHSVLWPCTDEIAAKYREKIFYFSSQEARDTFIQNPADFVAQTGPLKPPALRILMLGPRGSGKTTHGVWLARQLGLFHIQFREQLQTLIMAKTGKRVPPADEVVSLEDNSDDLEAKIIEARGENEKEAENSDQKDIEDVLTDKEKSIKAYLSGEDPLDPSMLDMLMVPYWKQEPYRSTGFILEGFPHDPSEVESIIQQHLFPDVVVVMEVEVSDVQKRLLPKYLENWHERRNKREAQMKLLRELSSKKREENISKRRAELMAERSLKEDKTTEAEDEEADGEEEASDNTEDEIEAILEEEFPPEEEEEDLESEETEDAATERLEMEIEERFGTDENNIAATMELLSEHNIPRVAINASHKLKISQQRLLQKIQPLVTDRESLLQQCQTVSSSLAQKLLLSSYKLHSAFGCCDPVRQYKERDLVQPLLWPLNAAYPVIFHQFIYFFGSKKNRNLFMLNPLKYLHQPKPTPPLPMKIAVIGPPKSGKTTVAQTFSQKYGLARLSIGGVMRTVLSNQQHTDLAARVKTCLSKGLVVPDELAVRCLEVVLMSSQCKTRGYVLDGFPMTLKQAELMESLSINLMLVVELELDTDEIQRRGCADKMKPNKPHLRHDSAEILHIYNTCYQEEVVPVRQRFQQQLQNYVLLDGERSKWAVWDIILKEVSIIQKSVQAHLDRTRRGRAARIHKLCITPEVMESRLGDFGQYCPVCLASHRHLVDCSGTAFLNYAAEYKKRYYKICSELHLEEFLTTPDQFVAPGCPHTLPQAHLLPRKITEIQVKDKFPQQVELKGFCPVTYLDGNQRYEALVRGKLEHAVEYKERIYTFETKKKQDKFMRTPETYWDQKLPNKVPPLCEPLPLTSLPTLGYLEQGVAVAVIKAMTAVGCLKPKFPFISVQRSALIYVAYYLKAFNHKSTDFTRQKYIKKLALFEESCALIPYLSAEMRGRYKPPSERPIDFEFKLKRFLALGGPPGTGSTP